MTTSSGGPEDAPDRPRERPRGFVPPPASPPRPVPPPGPPPPAESPAGRALAAWVRAPRTPDGPGVWTLHHTPRPPEEPDQVPGRQLVIGAVISALVAWMLWSILWNGWLGYWWLWPSYAFTPDSWWRADGWITGGVWASRIYYVIVGGGILAFFGRLGRWADVWRRYVAEPVRRQRAAQAAQVAATAPDPEADPVRWPDLRAAGPAAVEAADRLTAEAARGTLTDVDWVRLTRAWEAARHHPERLMEFAAQVRARGGAAYVHPSGARDVPVRTGRHDLAAGQVRIGLATDGERTPWRYRGVGIALSPETLATSAVVVGPGGAGKTSRLVRPVVENLCLHALTGQAAVVAVGPAGAGLVPDQAVDVVVRLGDPAAERGWDLYGGTDDADVAGRLLAEGLVGDRPEVWEAATALAQFLGPYGAVYGRWPTVGELRDLLDGAPAAVASLRESLEAAGAAGAAHLRELNGRQRQAAEPGDVGRVLAARLALLDRPAFAGLYTPKTPQRLVSLRALDRPVRVRIDLPEQGHPEASQILGRLVLAQYIAAATTRTDRSRTTVLVMDDAAHTITPETIRGIHRLRSSGAGVLLALRTLGDVAEELRAPLLGTVGCRVAMSGLTTWEGAVYSQVWGTAWVETRDVTDREIRPDEPMARVAHTLRRVVTGRAPTLQAVTVRQVERERWSASDLAHQVPGGHAVLDLTTSTGDRMPPLLVDLRS